MIYGELYDQAGVKLYGFPFAQQGLKYSHATNGGNKRATWAEAASGMQLPAFDPQLASTRLDIFDDGILVWRGRLWLRTRNPTVRSTTRQLTAVGYASHFQDDPYTDNKVIIAGSKIEDAFAEIRDERAPLISTSNVALEATGRVVATQTESVRFKNASELFQMLALLGNAGDQPLMWHVWEGAAGALEKPYLELRARPTTARYHVSVADGVQTATEESADQLANRLLVRYGAELTSWVQVDDATSQGAAPDGYGFVKTKIVDAPKLTSATDAANLGRTVLSAFKQIRPTAGRVVIPAGARVQGENGEELRLSLVKPGDYLHIRELRIGSLTRFEYEIFVAETDYDADRGSLSATPEQPEELTALLGRLLR